MSLGFASICENLFVAIFARGRMGPRRPDRSSSSAWRVRRQSRMRSDGVCGSQRSFRGGALRYYVMTSSPRCVVDACTAVRYRWQTGVHFTSLQLKQSTSTCQCMPAQNKLVSHSLANTASQLVYQANKASHSVFHVNKARLTAAMPTKQACQGQQSRANNAGQPTSHRASTPEASRQPRQQAHPASTRQPCHANKVGH